MAGSEIAEARKRPEQVHPLRNLVLPLAQENGTLKIIMSDPSDFDTMQKLQFILNKDSQPVLAPESRASDGKGGLWMTSATHTSFVVLLHYSDGQIVNAKEPFISVSAIPGTAQALGGNATGAATTPVVYQYS